MRKYSRISTKNARLIREMIQDARLLADLRFLKNKFATDQSYERYYVFLSNRLYFYVVSDQLDLWYRVQGRVDGNYPHG